MIKSMRSHALLGHPKVMEFVAEYTAAKDLTGFESNDDQVAMTWHDIYLPPLV